MTSRVTQTFRRKFRSLPEEIQKQARDAYQRFKRNPNHSSLRFKKLPPHENIWSVRVTRSYRAVGARRDDTIVWFFIGTHAEYDRLLAMM